MGMLAWKGTGRGGTPHLRGGTLEFQQDQGAGTLHDVEIKQEGFVPGLAEGTELVKLLTSRAQRWLRGLGTWPRACQPEFHPWESHDGRQVQIL